MNYLADMDFLYYHFLSSSAYNYNYRHQNDDILRKTGRERGTVPVSYTHLDVYKRQEHRQPVHQFPGAEE